MKQNSKKEQPVRLSNDELRKSRAGKLGCFPSDDLYEPETKGAKAHSEPRLIKTPAASGKHEGPRE